MLWGTTHQRMTAVVRGGRSTKSPAAVPLQAGRRRIAALNSDRQDPTQGEMIVGETLLGDGRGSTTSGSRVKRMWSTKLRIQPFEKRAHFAGS